MNAAGEQIGGNQHLGCAVFKLCQCRFTLRLAFITMQRSGHYARFVEFFGQTIGILFCADKHQHLRPLVLL